MIDCYAANIHCIFDRKNYFIKNGVRIWTPFRDRGFSGDLLLSILLSTVLEFSHRPGLAGSIPSSCTRLSFCNG